MFEFEITINFPDGKPDEVAVLEALFQAGLDDTIVGKPTSYARKLVTLDQAAV